MANLPSPFQQLTQGFTLSLPVDAFSVSPVPMYLDSLLRQEPSLKTHSAAVWKSPDMTVCLHPSEMTSIFTPSTPVERNPFVESLRQGTRQGEAQGDHARVQAAATMSALSSGPAASASSQSSILLAVAAAVVAAGGPSSSSFSSSSSSAPLLTSSYPGSLATAVPSFPIASAASATLYPVLPFAAPASLRSLGALGTSSSPAPFPAPAAGLHSGSESGGMEAGDMDTPQAKRERRKERNRIAAQHCRQRKIDRENTLRERLTQLQHKRDTISCSLSRMLEKKAELMRVVREHAAKGCRVSVPH